MPSKFIMGLFYIASIFYINLSLINTIIILNPNLKSNSRSANTISILSEFLSSFKRNQMELHHLWLSNGRNWKFHSLAEYSKISNNVNTLTNSFDCTRPRAANLWTGGTMLFQLLLLLFFPPLLYFKGSKGISWGQNK